MEYTYKLDKHEKHHFFIGFVLNNISIVQKIKNIQKILKKNYGLVDYHWNSKLFVQFLYIGYMSEFVAKYYMTHIITPLLQNMKEYLSPMDCSFKDFKLTYDHMYYKLSFEISDSLSVFHDKIIPFLNKNILWPIYGEKTFKEYPSLDILFYKKRKDEYVDKKITISIPETTFSLDYISLIKGTPVKTRSGTPSVHDQMHIEEMHDYIFPIK